MLVGAPVGVAQGLVAVLLGPTLGAGPDDVGWFADTPLQPGDAVVVPGPPAVVREWLLVPLVLSTLGAGAAGLADGVGGSRHGVTVRCSVRGSRGSSWPWSRSRWGRTGTVLARRTPDRPS